MKSDYLAKRLRGEHVQFLEKPASAGEKEVQDTIKRYIAALAKRDYETMRSLFTPSAKISTAWFAKINLNASEYIDLLGQYRAPVAHIELRDVLLTIAGMRAYARGILRIVHPAKSDSDETQFKFNSLLVRNNGTWLIKELETSAFA